MRSHDDFQKTPNKTKRLAYLGLISSVLGVARFHPNGCI